MASSLRDITISGNDIDSLVAFAKTRATKKTRWSISYKEPNEYQRTLGEVAKELQEQTLKFQQHTRMYDQLQSDYERGLNVIIGRFSQY